MSKTDDSRTVRSGLEAKYRQLEQSHREMDGKLDSIQTALDEVTRQHMEAIRRNDFMKATELRQVAEEMDAVRIDTAEALAGIERDAGRIAAEYRALGEKLRTPKSLRVPNVWDAIGADDAQEAR